MKSKFFYFFTSLAVVIILFFTVSISLKFYFNKFLYETPNLMNMTVNNAEKILENGEFKVVEMGTDFSEYPKGYIYTQLPKPGSPVKKGRAIKIWISKGEDKIILPNFSLYSLDEARTEAERLGLTIKNIAYASKNNVPFNQVIATEPKKGSSVYKNQGLSLLVNTKLTGEMVRVPDLIGMELYDVEGLLKKKKLILGIVSYIEDTDLLEGVVIDMSLDFGKEVPVGTVIDVTINR